MNPPVIYFTEEVNWGLDLAIKRHGKSVVIQQDLISLVK